MKRPTLRLMNSSHFSPLCSLVGVVALADALSVWVERHDVVPRHQQLALGDLLECLSHQVDYIRKIFWIKCFKRC